MTFKDNLVVCIKSRDGKVLREINNHVWLPFGSEYIIFAKNTDSVRMKVKFEIDGKDALDGQQIVLRPNESIDLERFMRNGNTTAGNRFKFIERTGAVEAHRGIGTEDGLIRVEAWREVQWSYQSLQTRHIHSANINYHSRFHMGGLSGQTGKAIEDSAMPPAAGGACAAAPGDDDVIYASASSTVIETINTAGVTAPGSESHQQFYMVPDFIVEAQSRVITLQLKGIAGNAVVTQPVTVKTQLKCGQCGAQSPATHKFCPQCGGALALI